MELIEKALGQIAYFACIYERYEARMLRYALRLGVNSNDEARDILQEAFINVWKHLNTFDPAMKFSSWLYRIVHNQVISHFRKQQSFGKVFNTSYDDSTYTDTHEESEKTEEDAMQAEISIRRILDQMPGKYREVLVLKFLEDKNYVEISDILKIPEGTVATRINRAKKAFRKLAKEQSISFHSNQQA